MASLLVGCKIDRFINFGQKPFVAKEPFIDVLLPKDYPNKPVEFVGDPAHVFFHETSQTWARMTIEADHESCILTGFRSYEAAMAGKHLEFYREEPMLDWLK